MEFRLYNKPNCNIFDLVGNKEIHQTKGLGLTLAESKLVLENFLSLIGPFKFSHNHNWIVDCEYSEKKQMRKNYRADIIITIYKNFNPEYVILIEGKSINANINPYDAAKQLIKYSKTYSAFKAFPKKDLIVLTNSKICPLSKGLLHFITWLDVINAISSTKETIALKYINYIMKISKSMKYYTHEVMSIPAGITYNMVQKMQIYICPATGKNYTSRAKEVPLYIAFRQRGGKITELYKIENQLKINLSCNKGSYITLQDAKYLNSLQKNLANKINLWCTSPCFKTPPSSGLYYVYMLDSKNRIDLPHAIIDKGKSGLGYQNHSFPKLIAILTKSLNTKTVNSTLSASDYD